MTFSSEVAAEGLFVYTARMIKRKRESYPTQQGFMNREGMGRNIPIFVTPVLPVMPVTPVTLVVPAREDEPMKMIMPTSVDNCDDDIEAPHEDDMQELGLPVTGPVAGEDELGETPQVVGVEGDDAA